MKKLITLAILLGLMFSSSSVFATTKTKIYTSKKIKVQLTIPKAWKITNQDSHGTNFQGKNIFSFDIHRTTINKKSKRIFKNKRISTCKKFAKQYAASLASYKIYINRLTTTKYSLKNYPACQITYKGSVSNIKIKIDQVLLTNKSHFYFMTGMAPTSTYKKAVKNYFQPVFQSLILL